MSTPIYAMTIASAERKFTEIAAADGNLVTYQREAMYAMQVLAGSEYLQKCSPDSLRNAVINIASVGLSLSPAMKLAYLVPRDGKACLDISYIGLIKIATDSGSVLAVKAEVVHENDGFEYLGPFSMPIHKFSPFASAEDRGDVIGAYVIAKLANGITQIETLSIEEIEKIRAKSKAKSGPWFDWFTEMVKKAAIKRASKMWPRTERLSTAEAVLNDHDGNEPIEGEVAEVVQQPKSKTTENPPESRETTEKPPVVEAKTEALVAGHVAASPGQIKMIRAKLVATELTEAELCGHLGVERLEGISVVQGNAALDWTKNPDA